MAQAVRLGSYPWLAWMGIWPLLVATRRFTPIKALLSGVLWGSGLYYFVTADMNPAFSHCWTNGALVITVPGVYALLGALVTSRYGFSPMGLALGWIGVEAALQPLGLSFGLLSPLRGYNSFLHMVVDFFGYGIIAFFIAYSSISLLSIIWNLCVAILWQQTKISAFRPLAYLSFHKVVYFRFLTVHDGFPRAPPLCFNLKAILNSA